MASNLLKLQSQIFNNSHLSPPPTPQILSRQSLPFFSANKLHTSSSLYIDLPKRSKLSTLRVQSSLSSTNPPTSREEAISQAKTCLSKALEKPLNNPIPVVGRLKKLKQPKFQLEIPILDDDSPSSLSQLALELFGALPVKRKGSKAVKILILWSSSKLRDAAIAAFNNSSSVKHVDISSSDYDVRSLSGADVAVFLAPERSRIEDVKRVSDGLYPNPVVIFNPKWGFDGNGGEFVDSFEVIYSFMGLEVQGVLSKRKGVIFKCGEKWNVLVEEEKNGGMKVISQFKSRPSIDEVENVLYNLMAINSPISKSAKFITDLVSTVTGGRK
ncbi:hypothetical protein LINGRAHAP2_LOCUS3326 [Linum grandiflorum]